MTYFIETKNKSDFTCCILIYNVSPGIQHDKQSSWRGRFLHKYILFRNNIDVHIYSTT